MSETYLTPGVYIEETSYRPLVATSPFGGPTAFVGPASKGPIDEPVSVRSFEEFASAFGALDLNYPLTYAVRDFFANGGKTLIVVRIGVAEGTPLSALSYIGDQDLQTGLFALRKIPSLAVLYLSPSSFSLDVPAEALSAAIEYCELHRAFLILDAPVAWKSRSDAVEGVQSLPYPRSDHAAMYFPRLALDKSGPAEIEQTFPPGGGVAGIYAATDLKQGVWKSPAGLSSKIAGYAGLNLDLSDPEKGELNLLAVNCLKRQLKELLVWGARTLAGVDELQPEYKYVAVRRLALFIENNLIEAFKPVAFEPNGPALWAKVREQGTNMLQDLFRKGAFQGAKSKDAYFLRCDASTMTQHDMNQGFVVIKIGFAPLKPAEFLLITIRVKTANASL